MLALAIAIGVGRFAFTPILPMMQKDYGLTLRMAGLLASANYVGYFIGALVRDLDPHDDRKGRAVIGGDDRRADRRPWGMIHHPVAWLLLRGLAGMVSAWMLVFAFRLRPASNSRCWARGG